jgi:serine phosphatase RsbU (regulator of sigma subunit)
MLRPLPVPDRPLPAPVPVESSLPGRAYARLQLVPGDAEANELWSPMLDSTERLGVVRFDLPDDVDRRDATWQQRCGLLAGLAGHLVHAKMAHGDLLNRMRRSTLMTPAAELLWQLLPPLTSSTEDLVITAIVQPQYQAGGDGYDYATDDSVARVVLVHALQRGLAGGMAAGVALAAIRAARRAGAGLLEQAGAADAALGEQFTSRRAGAVSAVLAELDTATGRLSYLNAGQPAPLLLRGTKLVGPLTEGRRAPLGRVDPSAQLAATTIEVGDRLLLYTDTLTDSAAADGSRFGVARLIALVEQCEAARLPAPETLRQLTRAMAAQQPQTEDTALVMLEWSAEAVRRVLPNPPPGDEPADQLSPQR